MDFVEFWTLCSVNGIVLTKEQIWQFERFHNEILYWNKQVNLISRKDEEYLLIRHIMHSLCIMKFVTFKPKARIIDIGTGGGFPGIPIKIANPEVDMLLVDSIRKKLKLAEMMGQHTDLKKINAICKRVEELNSDVNYQNKFDFIISRAVTRIVNILDWTDKMLKKDGKIVLLKGGDLKEEIEEANDNFSNIKITEQNIIFKGVDWFENENKKVVIVEIVQ